MYPDYLFPPGWREQREAAARAAEAGVGPQTASLPAREFWQIVWPELYGEVELDLAQAGLIRDLDEALRTHSVHFLASAVVRVARIESTWTRKAVEDAVRRRGSGLQDPDTR